METRALYCTHVLFKFMLTIFTYHKRIYLSKHKCTCTKFHVGVVNKVGTQEKDITQKKKKNLSTSVIYLKIIKHGSMCVVMSFTCYQ